MSFMQYQRCNICNINHEKGRSHIYSKKHVDSLKKALNKFRDKTSSLLTQCKSSGYNFTLKNSNSINDTNKKFWCYFCDNEFLRNKEETFYIALDWNFIEHLASSEHKVKLLTFSKTNKLKGIDLSPYFILETDFSELKDQMIREEIEFIQSYNQSLAKEMEIMKRSDERRENLLWSIKMADLLQIGLPQKVKIQQHKGQMLINNSQQYWNAGNVAATSPSTTSGNNEESSIIGPTKDDFLIYKYETDRRRKRIIPKIRPNLSSIKSQTLLNKLWLPYKVRRSLIRSKQVNNISADIKYDFTKSKFIYKPMEDSNDMQMLSPSSSSFSSSLPSTSLFSSTNPSASSPTSNYTFSSATTNSKQMNNFDLLKLATPYVSRRRKM